MCEYLNDVYMHAGCKIRILINETLSPFVFDFKLCTLVHVHVKAGDRILLAV